MITPKKVTQVGEWKDWERKLVRRVVFFSPDMTFELLVPQCSYTDVETHYEEMIKFVHTKGVPVTDTVLEKKVRDRARRIAHLYLICLSGWFDEKRGPSGRIEFDSCMTKIKLEHASDRVVNYVLQDVMQRYATMIEHVSIDDHKTGANLPPVPLGTVSPLVGTQVTSLHLSFASQSRCVESVIRRIGPQLTSLKIAGVFDHALGRALEGADNLQAFVLGDSYTKPLLTSLSYASNLESLWLGDRFTALTGKDLCMNEKLLKLRVSAWCTAITSSSVSAYLSDLPRLFHVYMGDEKVHITFGMSDA